LKSRPDLKNEHRVIVGERIRIAFGRDPFQATSVFSQPGDMIFCHSGSQTLLIRKPKSISDPFMISNTQTISSGHDTIVIKGWDETNHHSAEMKMEATENGIKFRLHAQADEPIWLVEWTLAGFDFDEIFVPALGGQSISRNMPDDCTLTYKYPFWWNAQFAIGMRGNRGCWFRLMDAAPRMKILRVQKENNHFNLTLGFEADAPLNKNELVAEWYLDCFQGDWKSAVDQYRNWMEDNFDLISLNAKPHYPEWAKSIDFILEIWGSRKESIEPMHTFEQMIDRLSEWKAIYHPNRTLVYLPGFAGNGIDSNIPDYSPSPRCGGKKQFKKLIDLAHEFGYRVMIHTNVLGMAFSHPLYKDFKKYQVIDPFGRPQGWGLDIDGDWLTEPYFAYIHPGEKAWSDLILEVLGQLIHEFKVDGVFLDQTLLAFNVSRGPNFIIGMREHIRRLMNNFPNILFAGEGMHEHILRDQPMAQIHGLDSIPDIHGMEGETHWRNIHPVSTYLFNKYVRFTAHLLTKHPSHPHFKAQESAYQALGVIPALSLYHHRQKMDLPDVHSMIERTRKVNGKNDK